MCGLAGACKYLRNIDFSLVSVRRSTRWSSRDADSERRPATGEITLDPLRVCPAHILVLPQNRANQGLHWLDSDSACAKRTNRLSAFSQASVPPASLGCSPDAA